MLKTVTIARWTLLAFALALSFLALGLHFAKAAEESDEEKFDNFLFYSEIGRVVASQEACGFHLNAGQLAQHIRHRVDPSTPGDGFDISVTAKGSKMLIDELSEIELVAHCQAQVNYALSNKLLTHNEVPILYGGALAASGYQGPSNFEENFGRLVDIRAVTEHCKIEIDELAFDRLATMYIPGYGAALRGQILKQTTQSIQAYDTQRLSEVPGTCKAFSYAAYIAGLIDAHEIATSEASQ